MNGPRLKGVDASRRVRSLRKKKFHEHLNVPAGAKADSGPSGGVPSKSEKVNPQTGLNFDPKPWIIDKKKEPYFEANCYVYTVNALNLRHDPLLYNRVSSSPGATKGWELPSIGCHPENPKNAQKEIGSLIKGAVSDGLVYLGKTKPNMKIMPGYLIAFYYKPATPDRGNDNCGSDFHFIRQDSRNPESWSGKWGELTPSQYDRSGKKITNPETANMGKYKFVGYFLAPKGGLNLVIQP